jgi:hypothetical protein
MTRLKADPKFVGSQKKCNTNNTAPHADPSTMANTPPSFATPLQHSIYKDCEVIVDDVIQSCFRKLPFVQHVHETSIMQAMLNY